MNDLQPLISQLDALLARLTPTARAALAREVARSLRGSQAKRIAAQHNPDGSPFEPRKPQKLRRRKGRLRAAMFTRLKMARHLKARSNASEAVVAFVGRATRIATVHQFGLRDRVNRRGDTMAHYPQRELLGFTEAERNTIETALVNHLAR